jgi:hypothetical protein
MIQFYLYFFLIKFCANHAGKYLRTLRNLIFISANFDLQQDFEDFDRNFIHWTAT